MSIEVWSEFGKIAGIAGLALGVFFVLFREIIRKAIFPTLTKPDAYRLLRLITVLIFAVAIAGIGAWLIGPQKSGTSIVQSTSGAQSDAIANTNGDVIINKQTTSP